ncbi:hypothetical protein ILUMI_02130 [Ignelater luminosus]|uniref:CHK kinase-like domain-containing protein n=1 Tax=Ignelater luminosus TaxID=2038154 RepID=A0A8K0GNH0_IGNLU|nr:hypothetical protein ILUMI_02130 [Ignelater luminosus]
MSAKTSDLVTEEVQVHIEELIKEIGITNHTKDISPGSALGENFFGIIARITVNGKDKSGENKVLRFIVKSAPRNEVIRATAPVRNAYNREIYMYIYHERALKSLDPVKDKIAYDKFKKFQENLFEMAKNATQPGPAGKYAVIGHGDCWSNNMLFKYNSSSKPHPPSEICLLDWQLARAGSPALDLAYFIFTCTDKPLRDGHYDHLIQEYYESLSSFLRELGSDPDKLFPFEVLQEHLKKFCIFGLFIAITIVYGMSSEAEDIPDIHNMTQLEELNFETSNIQKYYARIRGVVLDFIKFGYEF